MNDVVCVAHAVRCAWPVGLHLVAWEPLAVPPGLGDELTRHRPAGASRESSWYNVDGIIQELVNDVVEKDVKQWQWQSCCHNLATFFVYVQFVFLT